MIDIIQGTVHSLSKQRLVVMVQGIGYGVQVPNEHIFEQGQVVTLHTYVHWNQEQGPSLYGFLSDLDKNIFTLVISCSGIGPKIGLAVLATMSATQFITVITAADSKALSGVPGIGLKKAEALVLHLRDKVAQLVASGVILEEAGQAVRFMQEVSDVLTSLHYSRAEVSSALEYVKKNNDLTQQTFDGVLRKALSFLAQ